MKAGDRKDDAVCRQTHLGKTSAGGLLCSVRQTHQTPARMIAIPTICKDIDFLAQKKHRQGADEDVTQRCNRLSEASGRYRERRSQLISWQTMMSAAIKNISNEG